MVLHNDFPHWKNTALLWTGPAPIRNKSHCQVLKDLVGEGGWISVLIEVTHDSDWGSESCSNCMAGRSSVAQTLPAANSLGPAQRVREAQGALHAQLLLALHSQSTLKGESPGHVHWGKVTGHSCLTYKSTVITSSMKTKILTHAPSINTEYLKLAT